MARIGILGGSFNPIHNGHLHLADSAVEALELDQLLLMVAGEAPHKSTADYAAAEHRVRMCELAAEGRTYMSVSRYEVDKQGKSYTVETLRHLHTAMPGNEFFWLIGGDMLLSFTQWYCWEEILSLCTLAAVSRGEPIAPLKDAADALASYGGVVLLDLPPVVVSSTQIRENIKFLRNNSCYLPEKVVQYIRYHRLYADN